MFSQGYIGYTSGTVKNRYSSHKKAAKANGSYPIHNAIRKYGESLIVEAILEGPDEYCLNLEESLRPVPNLGWNISKGGLAPMLGKVHSEETRKRMSAVKKGVVHTPETCEKISASQRGKPRPPEATKKLIERNKQGLSDKTRKKISDSHKGKKASIETRCKLSTMRKGDGNSFYGKEHSEKTRLAISMAAKERAKYPWLHPRANKDMRMLAEDIRVVFLSEPNMASTRLEKLLGVGKNKGRSVHNKLKSGWIPIEDSAYWEWLEQYKQKETENVTQTIPSS